MTREPNPVPDGPLPGRALATRRAIVDLARAATLGSYGVAGFAAGPFERLRAALEGRPAGLRVGADHGRIAIALSLRVSHGLPIAEVARQVESAVRYSVRRSLGREVTSLTIRVGGLDAHPGAEPPHRPEQPPPPGSSALADPGTDVA
jgi:uncharacterized alkaline shock family protein YloU